MVSDPEIKDEINDAKDDLRETLHEIDRRVEKGVAKFRPDRGIRKHPMTSACIAAALGFTLGSDSGEAAIIGMLLLGTAVILTRAESQRSGEIKRV